MDSVTDLISLPIFGMTVVEITDSATSTCCKHHQNTVSMLDMASTQFMSHPTTDLTLFSTFRITIND